jgi:hypothetical protein
LSRNQRKSHSALHETQARSASSLAAVHDAPNASGRWKASRVDANISRL